MFYTNFHYLLLEAFPFSTGQVGHPNKAAENVSVSDRTADTCSVCMGALLIEINQVLCTDIN